MLALLKKWRQAYRDEKGDRLHAEAISGRNSDPKFCWQGEFKKWGNSISETIEESHENEDWNGRERY
ncbi:MULTISPECIES: hypothetical protein [unclassified Vibrio]|uniref:hypothetical protein n=1 Tax=unclassified Vibrio TaxID=2614977 RepID=UPI0035513C4B